MTGNRARGLPKAKWLTGFTLIELMIVVAVVGILAAIAYPSYQDHIRKTRRNAAQAFMMEVAQRQQQMFLDSRAFAGNVAALNMTVPVDIAPHYVITIVLNAGPPPTYTVTATPQGDQATNQPAMTLDSSGTKAPASAWK